MPENDHFFFERGIRKGGGKQTRYCPKRGEGKTKDERDPNRSQTS